MYNRKENGEIQFSLNDLLKVSDVLDMPVGKLLDQDLAKVITQTNNNSDTSGANIYNAENQTFTAEAYKVAIDNLKEEITYLHGRVDRLMEKLGG